VSVHWQHRPRLPSGHITLKNQSLRSGFNGVHLRHRLNGKSMSPASPYSQSYLSGEQVPAVTKHCILAAMHCHCHPSHPYIQKSAVLHATPAISIHLSAHATRCPAPIVVPDPRVEAWEACSIRSNASSVQLVEVLLQPGSNLWAGAQQVCLCHDRCAQLH
jgi:hypothetical protein